MKKVIGSLGTKVGMTQIIGSKGMNKGKLIPVTALLFDDDNIIVQVKEEQKDGYRACQLAFKDCSEKRANRPLLGHFKKFNILSPKRYLREIRDMEGTPGSIVDLSSFIEGEKVIVRGISKGKGTSGVIKRYHFKIGNKSHGASPPHRTIGPMGGGRSTNPGIPKGKKMPGRMGNEQVTYLSVIEKIDTENKIIFLRGSVPGPRKSLVTIIQQQ